MKIINVASEANPFSKTGGLGDVTYSLSKELTLLGEEVFIFLPLYRHIKEKFLYQLEEVSSFLVYISWRRETCKVYRTKKEDITYYFVDNDHYFNRPNLYGYFDDGERFAYFVMAVKEALLKLDLESDIIHLHDWQTAMLSCLIKEDKSRFFKDTKVVLTIHNDAFLGMMEGNMVSELFNLDSSLYESGKLRYFDKLSTLKAGIVYADKIVSVSPNRREELLTKDGGKGLETVFELRKDDFIGILNGIDYNEFNPSNDKKIFFEYNKENYFINKNKNKEALCKKLHIVSSSKPMFALVSRLTWQKGIDLVLASSEEMAKKGCNIVILGSGEYALEQEFESLRSRYPDLVAIYIGYNDELAHQIYASSDYFMMPSLFEPCGLGQMIAQRYGALPIVRETGGLKDTVIGFTKKNKTTANGFTFLEYSKEAMIKACTAAYDVYWDTPLRKQLMKNAISVDNSWKKSAKAYQKLYYGLVR